MADVALASRAVSSREYCMRLRLRFLWLIIASFFKKPVKLLDETVLNLRVFPNDIDVTKITNDRYSALMDLGRMDFAFRCGLRNVFIKKGWIPVVTFNTLRFRYPLSIMQKYQLKTRILWWDETTFYWEQIFQRNGRIVATGHISATVHKNGLVPTKEIVALIEPDVVKPDMPELVGKLRDAEKLIHSIQRNSDEQ